MGRVGGVVAVVVMTPVTAMGCVLLLEQDGDGTGVVPADVLELALLLDVVRRVVGRQGGAEPADVVLLADGGGAAASPKNVRYVALTVYAAVRNAPPRAIHMNVS